MYTADAKQHGYSIWVPRDAKRGLCLAYGARPPASLLAGLALHVDADPMCLSIPEAFDVVMLIGNPAAHPGAVSAGGRPDFIDAISRAWRCLHASGQLIVAFDPAEGKMTRQSGLLGWLRRRTWRDARTIDESVRALGARRVTKLHVLPSVWRPVLLYTPESPRRLKRIAFAHIGGWRARLMTGALTGGRASPLRVCPPGIVWIAHR